MRLIVAVLLAFVTLPALGQTCAAGPADPVPRDALRLNWNATTTWVVPPGGNIPTPTQVLYSVYRMVGTVATLTCTTTALNAGFTALPVGDQCYAVTARTPLSNPPNNESPRTATICKTIEPPQTTPATPGSFTITGGITVNLVVTPNP